jgi:hypothetical protein
MAAPLTPDERNRLAQDEPDDPRDRSRVERPVSYVVTSDMIAACPVRSKIASHYRPDGTCQHVPERAT